MRELTAVSGRRLCLYGAVAGLLVLLPSCGGGGTTTPTVIVVTPTPAPTPVPTPVPTPLPTPTPRPTPAPTTRAFVRFNSTSCGCVVGSIRMLVDSRQVGTMQCRQSRTFTITPGSHRFEARDNIGSWGSITRNVPNGQTLQLNLNCVFRLDGSGSEKLLACEEYEQPM